MFIFKESEIPAGVHYFVIFPLYRYKNLALVGLNERKIIGGCTVPHSRTHNPDLTHIVVGNTNMLDGFTKENNNDLLIALSTEEDLMSIVKWKISDSF